MDTEGLDKFILSIIKANEGINTFELVMKVIDTGAPISANTIVDRLIHLEATNQAFPTKIEEISK